MPIDVSQIQNYFVSSSPAALYLMQYFLPLLYLAIAVVVGVGAIRFGIAIFHYGIEMLFHKQVNKYPNAYPPGWTIQNERDFQDYQKDHPIILK